MIFGRTRYVNSTVLVVVSANLTVAVSLLLSPAVVESNCAVTWASLGKSIVLFPSCNLTTCFNSASVNVSPCTRLITGCLTTVWFCETSTSTSSLLVSGYVTSTVTYFLPLFVVTVPLFFIDVVTPPSLASCERFGTVTDFLILSKSELLILPILFTATGVVPAIGVYFSFWALTSNLNLTVVVFVGVVLSDATTVNTLSPNVVSVATFPDNVCDKGAASVALSLEVAPVSVTPLGNPDVVKFDSFPVLSEALTVISAFSPRYTVTFGTLASGVNSESVVSWLFCTNLTVGLPFSSTLNQPTTASSETFPERSVVLAITL